MKPAADVRLDWPSLERLPAYAEALRRGWSPDNVRGAEAAREELAAIAADPSAFVAQQVDREASGPPVRLPDGTTARRLPGYRLWIWDGEFCGVIGLRWQPGTSALPTHVLGHVGYAVVPWKRGLGIATRALGLMLDHARTEGLEHVEVTTDPGNVVSRKVIEANGGRLVETFRKPAAYGGQESLRFRIPIPRGNPP